MKGFPRRGSNLHCCRIQTHPQCLNEGLPQKGKQSGIRVILISSWRSLNEGLPQKGKQWPAGPRRRCCRDGLNEGLPQKGKQCAAAFPNPVLSRWASMKGFPRRGSNHRVAGHDNVDDLASMKGFPRRGSNAPRPRRGR